MKKSELLNIQRKWADWRLDESGAYYKSEFANAEKGHDLKYNLKIKISGTQNSTKWLSISKSQYKKIKNILLNY